MGPVIEQKAVEAMRASRHVLLMTDERLDGDTLGSSLGLFHVLREMGKTVTVYSPKPIPAQFSFLPGIDRIRTDDLVFADTTIDLAIICDCSDGLYLNDKLPLMPRKVPMVMFDHHSTNPRFGTYNFVEPRAASTADVVWRFLKRNGFPVPRHAAQCFLTGICTDTSLFSTSNTTAAAFEASVELTKRGAKLHEVVRHTMMDRPVPVLRVWGILFERLHYNEEFDALATALTQADIEACGNPEVETSSISNFLNATLDQADTILILREADDGSVKASLRSRGRDVAALAEKYGGGGHTFAAGFKVPNARLEQADGIWRIRRTEPLPTAPKEGIEVNFLK
ncbi:DHH family phosphoesterase [Candidatus Uhrbacteria bacterium]|nr:DHH family phosphoesterase [Candidatus Uhrbacteria bacterium]